MTWFDYVLVFGTLAAMIGLPIMGLRALLRRGDAEYDAATGQIIMRPSAITPWMVAFMVIVPWLGVVIRYRAGQSEPDFSPLATGPFLAVACAATLTLVAIWLMLRHWRRVVRYDETGITARGRQRAWTDLASVSLRDAVAHVTVQGPTTRSLNLGSDLRLTFQDGCVVRMHPDLSGQKEFQKMLRKICRTNGVPYGKQRGRKRA